MRPCGVSTFGKSFRISWFPGAESFHERPLAVQSIWGVRFEFDAYDLHRHRVMASIVIPKVGYWNLTVSYLLNGCFK